MEDNFSRELNVDSLAEDSLDSEEAAIWEPTLEVDQMFYELSYFN